MSKCPEYLLRTPTEEDYPFIFGNWKASIKSTMPYYFIPKPILIPHQDAHIQKCLSNFDTYLLAHPDDPGELFGFITYSFINHTLLIHWAYVKEMWKRQGLMNSVLSQIYGMDWKRKPIVVTQMSKYYTSLNKKLDLSFDPYYVAEL